MVYLLPLPARTTGPAGGREADALLAEAAGPGDGGCLRTDASTGAWHLDLTLALCEACSIAGLAFLAEERRVLTPDEAANAVAAVGRLLARLEAGPLPDDGSALGPRWEALKGADWAATIADALPCSAVDDEGDPARSYVEFLVALQLSATEAQAPNLGLLFARPGPRRPEGGTIEA